MTTKPNSTRNDALRNELIRIRRALLREVGRIDELLGDETDDETDDDN